AEHEEQNGVQALHGAFSVASRLFGSSLTIPSTPAAVTRRAAASSFTVHAKTGAPSRCAVATAVREQRVWCRVSVFARAQARSTGMRAGIAARRAAAPARVTPAGQAMCETP